MVKSQIVNVLEVYDLEGNLIGKQNRKEFYKEILEEYRRTGKITKQVKSIRVLVLSSKGRIYIQHRSEEKDRNPGLYDKTIGGHLEPGHTWDLTVVKECHEELGFPGVVLSDDEFRSAIPATNLKIIGILRRIEHMTNFISINNIKGEEIKQPFITTFYIGYYDGPISFCDGESVGIEVVDLKTLKKRIKERPKEYTEDLKYMIKRYEPYLVPIDKENAPVRGFEDKQVIKKRKKRKN